MSVTERREIWADERAWHARLVAAAPPGTLEREVIELHGQSDLDYSEACAGCGFGGPDFGPEWPCPTVTLYGERYGIPLRPEVVDGLVEPAPRLSIGGSS